MKTALSAQPASQVAVDALAIAVSPGAALDGPALALDQALGGVLSEILAHSEFDGDLHRVFAVPTRLHGGPWRVLLYGLGPLGELDGQRLRSAHEALVRAARANRYRSLGVLCGGPVGPDTLKAVVEGCVLGNFERRSRQTEAGAVPGNIDELVLVGFGADREGEAAAAQQNGEATNRAREWQNTPANELTPDGLAQEATKIAGQRGLESEILGPSELREGGYNLLLGVAYGSAQPPRMITLRHRPSTPVPAGSPVLAIIGKGITFDSGGISLKNPERMSYMKADMAGAAAVLAAIDVIAARQLPIEVMAVVAATENMPGATAQRPGDVLKSANGKTVEIVNTDAEGRLVLADALTHALRRGATHMIDLATLTGAATVAIGHAATAAVSNDDAFWAQVDAAAGQAGERVWRLPMLADYRVLLRSRIADLRNSEYGEAGMILGGMFIGEFAGETPWTHLDIAASSWNLNDELTTVLSGPSGAGTRICIELAERMAGTQR